jgi:N-acylglucosamine 2-epimerase
MFSKLCNEYGANDEWINLAKNCLEFLNNNCIDASDGRMYFTVSAEGAPLRKRRYFFSETFYIIANAEYYKATGDKNALDNAIKYFDFVYKIYKNPNNDPYKITPKFLDTAPKLKSLACPMILLNVNGILRENDPANREKYNKIAESLITDIKSFKQQNGDLMLENVGLNGEYYSNVSACRVINPGHSIELSWFLMDEAGNLSDHELFSYAENMFNAAYEFGLDHKYGGILYFKDAEGYPVEAYEHDMKLWWPHVEAIIASLKLYKKTNNPKYFKMFEEITDYSFKHFSDPEYGEWFGYLRRDGLPTEPPCKGHTYKGPFHVMRMLCIAERILSKLV